MFITQLTLLLRLYIFSRELLFYY
uniref:Uncharacterized protein n=1 Tax=Rhizophora mucronata TaxID=61149 RepID=A0A2P2QI01_RHIMU